MANSPPPIRDSASPGPERRPPTAGGCLIAGGAVAGPVVGLLFGEVTLGLLGGLAIGALGALAMVIAQRRR